MYSITDFIEMFFNWVVLKTHSYTKTAKKRTQETANGEEYCKLKMMMTMPITQFHNTTYELTMCSQSVSIYWAKLSLKRTRNHRTLERKQQQTKNLVKKGTKKTHPNDTQYT